MTTGTTAAPGYWWNGWEYEFHGDHYNPCAGGHVFRWASNHTGDKEPPEGTVCECDAVVWGRSGEAVGRDKFK